MNGIRSDVVGRERAARRCVEVFTEPHGFKTRKEWIEALDETLSDLTRSFRKEPSVTILGVLEEMVA